MEAFRTEMGTCQYMHVALLSPAILKLGNSLWNEIIEVT
jgi:hypothetical protein